MRLRKIEIAVSDDGALYVIMPDGTIHGIEEYYDIIKLGEEVKNYTLEVNRTR